MAKPEHHGRWQVPTKLQHRRTRRRNAPSAPRWRSRTAPNTRGFDVKVDGSASAQGYNRKVRLRLRSQIGEVRGSLYRISVAEYLAREAAVGGGAGAEPSSSPSSKVAAHATNQVFSVTCYPAAVLGGAEIGSSSWSPKAHPHGTKRLLLAAAAAEPRPEASATPTASKRRRTIIQGTEPPVSTPAELTLKALQVVPERRNAEPDVLLRATFLKTRFAGLIAKAEETLSIRHRQDLEKQPAADEGSRAREAEGEMALLQEEERNARVGALRKKAREALQEVERKARLSGLGMVEAIHPAHLMELGITAVEHVVSPERSRDHGTHKDRRPRSPLEELGLFVKPVDDCCEEEMETT